jgi:hypothetical protein
MNEEDNIPTVNLEMTTRYVYPLIRKIKIAPDSYKEIIIEEWENKFEDQFRHEQLIEDLNNLHGIDIIQELENILIAELDMSIHNEIQMNIERL